MPEDLGLARSASLPSPAALDDARLRSERRALRDCLERSGQNVSRVRPEVLDAGYVQARARRRRLMGRER